MIGFMNRAQIDHILNSEVVARLGCATDEKVYVVPITYVYDGKKILAHTTVGLKVDMMRANPEVCIEVDRIENLANWQSVIAWGTFKELEGKLAEDALQKIVNRIHPFKSSETTVPRHGLERPHAPVNPHIELIVFQITIKEVTGKFEKQ
jgi:uncharacterized protein